MESKKKHALTDGLAAYIMNLTKLGPNDITFIILYGSAGEGKINSHSDYDVKVVARKRLDPERKPNIFGVYNNRLVDVWITSLEHYNNFDRENFAWKRAEVKKLVLLYGDKDRFNRFIKNAHKQEWDVKRQNVIIADYYGKTIEYFCKMLDMNDSNNKVAFYYSASQLSFFLTNLIAAVNRIDINSENTMHNQIFKAKIKPKNLKRDLLILSGFQNGVRDMSSTLTVAKRLVGWSKHYITSSYPLSKLTPESSIDINIINLKFD